MPRYVESAPYGIRKNIGNIRGFHTTREFSYRFNTNSQGFRGTKEYNLEKPQGIKRIIVLGDSVALGHGVAYHETFSYLLEKKLNQNGYPAEVINMAVSGFGTAEELVQYQNLGRKYHPDIVILSYSENDPMNNAISNLYEINDGQLLRKKTSYEPALSIRDNLNKIPFYGYLAQHSHFVCFLRSRFSGLYLNKLGKKRRINVQQTQPQYANSYQMNPNYITLTAALLNEFITVCNKDGVKLIIVDIPGKSFTSHFPYERIKKQKTTFIINLTPTYLSYKGTKHLFYIWDSHPNQYGHELIASKLLDAIIE